MSDTLNTCLKNIWKFTSTSIWAFPVILGTFFIILSGLKINGSSVGTYHATLYGADVKDSSLLYGKPQPIRSDEWLRSTQSTISQSKNNFPIVNQDILYGSDVSLSTLPSRDWSRIFMPETWAYFFMPLEYAFAVSWWLILFLLAIAVYFLSLRLLPNNKYFAICLGLVTALSPYQIWWYKPTAYLPPAFGIFALLLFMRIIDNKRIPWIKNRRLNDLAITLALGFTLGCFGLAFYPPYQIPIAIVVGFISLGYLLEKLLNEGVPIKNLTKKLCLVFVGVVMAGVIGGAFLISHRHAIDLASNSVYPGSRRVTSGNMNFLHIFSSFVMPVQQSLPRASHFFTNQSEAANFMYLTPFLILPGILLLVYGWRKNKKIDWVFLFIELIIVIILCRMFISYDNLLFKLLLLERVPNARLVMGLEFAGLLQLIYVVKHLAKIKLFNKYRWVLPFVYSAICFGVLLVIGRYIMIKYPGYIGSKYLVIALAATYSSIILAFLLNLKKVGISILLLFTLASVFRALPLYRGLGILNNSAIIHKIQEVSPENSYWVTVGSDANIFDNFGTVAGRGSLSGTQSPRPDFWINYAGPEYEKVYNRQGNVFFTDNKNQNELMTAPFPNVISVRFQCGPTLEKYVQYVLSVHPLKEDCVELLDTVKYPKLTFYLYKVVK